jgi:hypothetical protein
LEAGLFFFKADLNERRPTIKETADRRKGYRRIGKEAWVRLRCRLGENRKRKKGGRINTLIQSPFFL